MNTYFKRVRQLRSQRPYLREGQAHMMALEEMKPGIYRRISRTPFDPFYRDDRINPYLSKVSSIWDDYGDDDDDGGEITINLDLSWPFL